MANLILDSVYEAQVKDVNNILSKFGKVEFVQTKFAYDCTEDDINNYMLVNTYKVNQDFVNVLYGDIDEIIVGCVVEEKSK